MFFSQKQKAALAVAFICAAAAAVGEAMKTVADHLTDEKDKQDP